MVNGKNKGSSFERKIAKTLSEITGLEFRRTFGSGAFKNRHKELDESGDLKCSDANFPFSIECKFYKDLNYANVIHGKNETLNKWITQCIEDAKRQGKIGLLIIKTNQIQPFAVFCFRKQDKEFLERLRMSTRTYLLYRGCFMISMDSVGRVLQAYLKE